MKNATTPPQPDITRTIEETLYHYVVQRDMYYSDLKEEVITDDEWIKIRDKIQDEAVQKLVTLVNKARIDELKRFLVQHFDENTDGATYDWIIINIKERLKELSQ